MSKLQISRLIILINSSTVVVSCQPSYRRRADYLPQTRETFYHLKSRSGRLSWYKFFLLGSFLSQQTIAEEFSWGGWVEAFL